MKTSKTALVIIFLLALSCQTKTIYRPEPVYIAAPVTRQEIINQESKLTQMEALLEKSDRFFYTTWVDQKTGSHYIINQAYLDLFLDVVRLKNKYIQELEMRIEENNKLVKSKK